MIHLVYRLCLVFAIGLFTVDSVSAATITVQRGPYLQQGAPDSIVVRWRTDLATDSRVRYGTVPDSFTGLAGDAVVTTEHVVKVTALTPDTKYYYQIGTSTDWFPGDTNDFFVTPPVPGVAKPTRIWVLGDAGTADANQIAVRNAYTQYSRSRATDLWLMLGDNAYEDGTDAEFQAAVFDMYPTYLQNAVLWPTIGNHERDAAYLNIFTLPRNGEAGGVASGTENYYSFDYANIHFICLDSYSSDRSSNAPMFNWLRADLESTTQEWLIAFWHHPPYSRGTHNSDTETELVQMRRNFLPMLEAFGVDLVLGGHSHNYERSVLLDGHYGVASTLTQSMKKDGGTGREDGSGAYRKSAGTAAHEGAVYTVAGSSGGAGGGSLNHPAMVVSLNIAGSVVIDLSGNRLDFTFVQANGAIGDYFTMIKSPLATNAPAAPTELAAVALSSREIQLSWTDNADNETSFKVERSTNGVNFAQFATVGANITNGLDTALQPSTTYFYRVRASNAIGDSPYSNIAQATTAEAGDETPPGAVTNLFVSGVTSNSVSLLWTAPGDDGYSGSAARYDVRYSIAPVTEINWASAAQANGEPTPAGAGNSQAMTVGGLAAGITYSFAMKSLDEENNVSALSNVRSAMTTRPTSTTHDTAIVLGAVWKFLDNGSNQGTNWRTANFNDAAWAQGRAQLGYGDGDETTVVYSGPNASAKYITTYFRHAFDIADPSRYNALELRLLRDDGAVVYLNGTEVFRSNLPTGTIGYQTLASAAATENAYVTNTVSTVNLVAGRNVLAVEVHQNNGTSTDLSFDLELRALKPVPDSTAPAAITNLAAGNITANSARLTWTAPGDDNRTGTATLYDARYSTSPINNSNWDAASALTGEPAPGVAGTSQNFTVSGLAPGTTYFFAIKAIDEAGNAGLLSNVPSTTTLTPPSITSQPTNQIVAANGNVTFRVTATGAGTLTYRWRFNGTNLSNGTGIGGATTATLTLSNVQPARAGNYSVVVSNAAAFTTSSNALLTVIPPPTLAEAVDTPAFVWRTGGDAAFVGQTSVARFDGDAAQSGVISHDDESWMETTVVGPGTLTFWWRVSSEPSNDRLRFYRNGSQQTYISGTVDWQLMTYSLPSGNQVLRWRYTKNGSTTTGQDRGWVDQVVFTPPGPIAPAITTQPSSRTVDTGANVSFSVVASGTAPLGYQWLSNGIALVNGGNVGGATSSTLTLFSVQVEQNADYSVVVTNAAGAVTSAVAALTVRPPAPPTISSNPASRTVDSGASASFTVVAAGAAPLGYQWFSNGVLLADGGQVSGAASTTLTLSNVQVEQGGGYSVVITNFVGGVTSTVAVLTVRPPAPPTITTQPTSRTVSVGASTTFNVTAAGAAPLAYQWLLEGSPISGANASSLAIANVQSSHAGGYSVLVTNVAGSITSAVAMLTVTTAPQPPPTMNDAVDAPTLTFQAAGNVGWTPQRTITFDGVDAARSGVITDGQNTRLETHVTGPGTISFRWKVSSEPTNDQLRFYIGDVEQARITGEVEWESRSFSVPSGSSVLLKWRYSKSNGGNGGLDAGFVDQIQYIRN